MKEKKDITGNESIIKKGVYGIAWNFSGSIIQILSQLLIIGILARLLTPDEFGLVAIIMIFVTFSELFTNMGIAGAIVQLPKITQKHIALGYTLSLLIGLFVGSIFYFSAPYTSAFFDVGYAIDAFHFFALFFPFRSFCSIATAIMTRKLRFPLMVKCSIFSSLFGGGVTSIVLAYCGFGYWSLILGQFMGLVFQTLFMIYFEKPFFSINYNKRVLGELLFFGSGHTLGTIFNYIAENVDNILVGKFLGTIALGIYSKAFQLLAIPAKFFGSIFDKVLFPIASKKQNEKEKLAAFYIYSTSVCFGILTFISVLIYLNAELIVSILLGGQWNEVIVPMKILIFAMAFRFGSKINKLLLKSMGMVYKSAYYQFLFAIIMVLLCSVGGYWYKLPGVAIGVLCASIINYFQVGFRLYNILSFSSKHFFEIFIKTILFNVGFLIIDLFLIYDLKSIWVNGLLSVLIYLPLMLFLILNKRGVIFNENNFELNFQIMQALPTRIQKSFMKISLLKKYYAQ